MTIISQSKVVTTTSPRRRRINTLLGYGCFVAVAVSASILYVFSNGPPLEMTKTSGKQNSDSVLNVHTDKLDRGPAISVIPDELIELGVYKEADFQNEIGISPPYWKPNVSENSGTTWGPCFRETDEVNWKDERNTTDFVYRHNPASKRMEPTTDAGGCRPGFLIIGAGKCGTSSLYQYLLGHPRVAPAFSKQIHYFIYHLNMPMGWYYAWFPTATSFLEHGTLLTGEASPGYLPYPNTVKAVKRLLPGRPKIVMIGRNPLTRMYSSYRYNYVVPTLDLYRKGRKAGIPKQQPNQSDDIYDPYLFTFEELVKAELKQLKACLNDFGPAATRDRWYKEKWTVSEFDRREKENLDPLIDLDLVCYGKQVNQTVLRPQWAELQVAHPKRYISSQSAFLIQSIIGRSLYVFPLEWWYIKFDSRDILFYCTEELSDPDKLNDLAMQMGLPSYDFSDVVAQGAFNVGGHRGYDKATPWEELEEEAHNATSLDDDDGIPLSAETRQEVLDFVRPYNERLFQLVGKRCQGW